MAHLIINKSTDTAGDVEPATIKGRGTDMPVVVWADVWGTAEIRLKIRPISAAPWIIMTQVDEEFVFSAANALAGTNSITIMIRRPSDGWEIGASITNAGGGTSNLNLVIGD